MATAGRPSECMQISGSQDSAATCHGAQKVTDHRQWYAYKWRECSHDTQVARQAATHKGLATRLCAPSPRVPCPDPPSPSPAPPAREALRAQGPQQRVRVCVCARARVCVRVCVH
eukprot:6211837-Pleurochrysis_carterae.AAC.5